MNAISEAALIATPVPASAARRYASPPSSPLMRLTSEGADHRAHHDEGRHTAGRPTAAAQAGIRRDAADDRTADAGHEYRKTYPAGELLRAQAVARSFHRRRMTP